MFAAVRVSTLLLTTAVLLGVPGLPVAAQQPKPAPKGKAADVFGDTKLWPVHVTIPAAEYDAMQPAGAGGFGGFGGFGGPPNPPKKPADGREVHRNAFGVDLPWAFGSVEVGGQTFEKVGLRYKGNGTIMDAARTIKKSIKVDLDRHDASFRFRGLKTINLHSGVADPSKARETLGYAAYRAAGVPAPRTALAEVTLTVPGKFDREYLGLYTIVEQIDGTFLRRHYGSDRGLLMKPERVGGLNHLGPDWERYKTTYQPKRDATPDEQKRVIAFTRLVNQAADAEFEKEIGSYLDVNAFLRFMAVTALEANLDSFFTLGHNYCLYLHPETSKFHFIPWDLDRTFGNFGVFGSPEQLADLSITRPAGQNRLVDRLMAVKEVADKYRQVVKEITSTTFTKDRLQTELAAVEEATREIRARETKAAAARREGGPGGFGPPGAFGRVPEMKSFIEQRTESVAAQLAGKSTGHVPQGFGFGPPGGGFGGPGAGNQLARPLLVTLDGNRDGKVSEAELASGMKRLFAEWDANKDGSLDQRELADGLQKLAPPPKKGPFGGPPGGPGGGFPPKKPDETPSPRPRSP
jgi:spore coat protein H